MVFLPLMEAYFTPCGAVEASAQGAADLDVGCREGVIKSWIPRHRVTNSESGFSRPLLEAS
ncbi:MAG: hypothetical protein WBW69_01120 [Candidatus Korobacteraceae bacterium]